MSWFRGDWKHRLTGPDCLIIDLLAYFAEVILVTVWPGQDVSTVLVANPVYCIRETIYVAHFSYEQCDVLLHHVPHYLECMSVGQSCKGGNDFVSC